MILVFCFQWVSESVPSKCWFQVYRCCPTHLTRHLGASSIPTAFFILYQDTKGRHCLPFFSSPLSFSDAPKPSMVPISANPSVSDSVMHSSALKMKKYVSSQKLAGGGRCSVQWRISWLVGNDMHSVYPKLHEDELLTSTPARTEELETSLSSLLVKQSLFTVMSV